MIDLAQKQLRGPFVRLHPRDNVVVARGDVPAGTAVPEERFVTAAAIPAGHKAAAAAIARGEPIRKYAEVIGFAAEDIAPGAHVHSHNVRFEEFDRDYAFGRDYAPVELLPEPRRATFQGIVREDGRVATRNYVGVVSTVNCSATVVRRIADWFTPERLAAFPNVDGVAAFSHPLGCERNELGGFCAAERLVVGPRLRTFVMQETGGTRRTIEAGVAAVRELLPDANRVTRRPVPASHLVVGLQCGGSDAFSSITANPALGAAVDLLARHGGTAILSETPEIYGVEHTLTRRAASRAVGEKLVERIRWWKDVYAVGRDVQINGRVSPGNHAGGLANIFEKSLGSSMKGGTGPLMEVYRYAEPVTARGLVFMDTPGYDPVSATGQIAGGANLVAFTTGRGSAFGTKPVPTLKLATNTPMFRRLEEDMDVNCGGVLDGALSIEEMGARVFERMLATASGEKTKSELLGMGDNEFVPWQIGIVG